MTGSTDIETACRAAALRFLTLADEEPDPVRRVGLLDLAAGSLSAARDHALVAASAVLRDRPPRPGQRELPT